MKVVIFELKDGSQISGSLFLPKESVSKFVIINSATGVKQQKYYGIAEYLAKKGITVLTYDYSGIGASKPSNLKRCRATMRSWGTQDYEAACEFMLKKFPNYERIVFGHSVGALIVGMSRYSSEMDDFIFIATQNPYYRYLSFKTQILGWIGFGVLQPLLSSFLGYFPGQWFGLGESLPTGCASDWRQLILKSTSTNYLLSKVENYSKNLNQNVLVLRAEDDAWVTEKGVESLLRTTYTNLKHNVQVIKVSESVKKEIGHINFFRTYNMNLWKIVSDRILK